MNEANETNRSGIVLLGLLLALGLIGGGWVMGAQNQGDSTQRPLCDGQRLGGAQGQV